MRKRLTVIIVLCIAIAALIFFVFPAEVNGLTNAAVNEENGDVAFCYPDYSGKADVIRVELYNKDGERLFEKTVYPGAGAHVSLCFCKGNVYVYVGRYEAFYTWTREGVDCKSLATAEQIESAKSSSSFTGWKNSFASSTYVCGENEYVYRKASLFGNKAQLLIKNADGERVIYESP